MEESPVFGEKLPGIAYLPRTGVYGIAQDGEGRAAIVRIPTGYFLIGGGIEPGEEREEALRREFLEETGFEIEIGPSIGMSSGYYYSDYFGRYVHGTGHFYHVTMGRRAAQPVEKDHTLVFVDKVECVQLLKYDYQRWAVIHAFGLE